AGPDDAPVGHHDLERQHRIARLAVLDAAQAAGIGAQVPPDRAHLEAGRIRGVEKALGGDCGLELRVDDPRLDDRDQVLPVDLDDPVHRGEDHGQPALDAGRAAGQTRPRPARDDRHSHLGRDPHDLDHVRGRRREDHRTWQPGVEIRRLVVAVALAVERVGQEPEAWQARRDRGNEWIRRGGGRRLVSRHGPSLRGHAKAIGPRGRMTAMSTRVLSIATALLTLTIAASGLAVAPVRAEGSETDEAPAAPLGVASPAGIQPANATLATAIVPGSVGRSSLFVDATY